MVNAQDCIDAQVRLYDRLFKDENPEKDGRDFVENLNPDSLEILEHAKTGKKVLKRPNLRPLTS